MKGIFKLKEFPGNRNCKKGQNVQVVAGWKLLTDCSES
ncbi:MAG: hypothetical protein A4E66_02253 [Syntrophus sp. PtaB.Bin001]|nr:MAG: hypothetical protein A4E66_02253 [Syntrophus sp. PtaB.Bin001]